MRRGFTLIELLVVIAIIGILAAIVVTNVNVARAKSRDARRLSEAHNIQQALELFYEANGYYPYSQGCGSVLGSGHWCDSSATIDASGSWIHNASDTQNLSAYFSRMPVDPLNKPTPSLGPVDYAQTYNYYAMGACTGSPQSQWYMLVVTLEIPRPDLAARDGVRDGCGTLYDDASLKASNPSANPGILVFGNNHF